MTNTNAKQNLTKIAQWGALGLLTVFFGQAFAGVPSRSPASIRLPAPWQQKDFHEADAGWIIPQSPTHASVTITSTDMDEAVVLSQNDEDKIVSIAEKVRAVPYWLFGITNWKVEKHHIFSNSVLEMEGHYKATSGTPVHFVERDFFVGKKSYAITFFEDDNGSPAQSSTEIQKVLDQFKPNEAK